MKSRKTFSIEEMISELISINREITYTNTYIRTCEKGYLHKITEEDWENDFFQKLREKNYNRHNCLVLKNKEGEFLHYYTEDSIRSVYENIT